MFINFIVKYIIRQKSLRTATTSGSNLPEHNLSEMLNSSDTTSQEIDSPYEYSKSDLSEHNLSEMLNSSDTTPQEIDSSYEYSKSDLSEHNLSEMFNSADTKLQEIDSPYQYNIILYIDSTIVGGQVIQLKYEKLKKDAKIIHWLNNIYNIYKKIEMIILLTLLIELY
ncbi:hypothetical protein [Ehrlichia ruminantium]|uniref:hypothetical protein n=1 Tax=Ehrlichia ruminantium TaxID=779 RepID=UPI001E2C0F36|nr:hypothetical protein [Ehrlichia ruminantium]